MPKDDKEKDVDEIVKDLNEVGNEDARAPGMPPEPPGAQKPNPMQLNRLEMQDVNEMLALTQQNAMQIGQLTFIEHQIAAQQEKLDKQNGNLEKQKANVLEQRKELLTTADNHKQAIDRILEKARKRMGLPDDRIYGLDQKTWTFIDQGPTPKQQ